MRFSIKKLEFIETELFKDKKAIVASDCTLSWEEFRLKVYILKDKLEQLNIPKGHPVMIYGHKEADFIVAKTALMMAKLPYVPVDTIFPIERIILMQSISKSQVLINCTSNDTLNDYFDVIFDLKQNQIHNKKSTIEFSLNDSFESEITYVLFTSGSTGQPKGVPIGKKGVDLFAEWLVTDFPVSSDSVFLNVSALSFDFVSYEEYSFLDLGATIVLIDNQTLKDSKKLINIIQNEQIDSWVSTPSLVFMYLMEPQFNHEVLKSIKTFVFAGENLPLRTVKKLFDLFPHVNIINTFGPTEATNLTTKIHLTNDLLEKYNAVPIGYPKPDSEIILVNSDEEGVGEIVIVGEHVTFGYLKNEALNVEKFYLHEGKRAYKSGDLGFFKDNLLFYAGRNDEMIKLHGYRIELEDITSVLKEMNEIENAATIGLKSKGETKKIVSFVVLKVLINKDEILLNLKNKLPEFMIPADIKIVKDIPLNTSSKVNKSKLQEMYLKG
jgi:D-alanine--poly(phosphoribitol) ligase subunit 1